MRACLVDGFFEFDLYGCMVMALALDMGYGSNGSESDVVVVEEPG